MPRPLEEVARGILKAWDGGDFYGDWGIELQGHELIAELREALAERDEWLAFCRRTLLKVPPIYINGR